jgi:hypothetical protein
LKAYKELVCTFAQSAQWYFWEGSLHIHGTKKTNMTGVHGTGFLGGKHRENNIGRTGEGASLATLKNWRSPSCAQRVHAYARVCVSVCVHVCDWAFVCVRASVSVLVRVHVYVRVRACEYLCAFVFVCACACVCVCVCNCVFVCVPCCPTDAAGWCA